MTTKNKILWLGFVVTFVAAMALRNKIGYVPMILPWAIFAWAMLDFYGLTPGTVALKRNGIVTDARVLQAERTNTQEATGQAAYAAPFVWKYHLQVTLPGQAPYTTTLLTTDHLSVGETVVKVGHRNHKHVVLA